MWALLPSVIVRKSLCSCQNSKSFFFTSASHSKGRKSDVPLYLIKLLFPYCAAQHRGRKYWLVIFPSIHLLRIYSQAKKFAHSTVSCVFFLPIKLYLGRTNNPPGLIQCYELIFSSKGEDKKCNLLENLHILISLKNTQGTQYQPPQQLLFHAFSWETNGQAGP